LIDRRANAEHYITSLAEVISIINHVKQQQPLYYGTQILLIIMTTESAHIRQGQTVEKCRILQCLNTCCLLI